MEKRESIAALLRAGQTPKQISTDLNVGLTLIYKVKKLFFSRMPPHRRVNGGLGGPPGVTIPCLLYTSDAADE